MSFKEKGKGGPINQLHETEARWFAAYTGFKREKFVKRLLDRQGIHTYLPLLTKTRRYTRKIKEVQLPLIPCYIFVKIVKDEYVKVLSTEYIHGFVKFNKDMLAIPDEEIELLRAVVGENAVKDLAPDRFMPGAPVEIIGGSLTGVRGTLVEIKGKKEFVVDFERVGYSLLVNIDPKYLRRIRD